MPGEEDRNPQDVAENLDEGLEAEADAEGADSEVDPDGDDAEGAAEGDGADAQEGQEVDGEPRRPTRGEARFQTLNRRAQEATERATRAENELRAVNDRLARLERPPEQPRGRSPEELALMTPDELINYRLGEATKGFEQKLGAIQWATYEQSDRAAFNSLKASNPLAAKYADEVEQRLTTLRAQGQNVDRERLFTYLIGEKALAARTATRGRQTGEGQRRIARQTTRPGAGQRSDTPSNRGRMTEQEARDKRLENITF